MSEDRPELGTAAGDAVGLPPTLATLALLEQVGEPRAGRPFPHVQLGNYRVLEKIGAGGMGRVFKAEHVKMLRIVAVKVMSPGGMLDPNAVSRFQQEVRAIARLAHPNIVTAHDADEASGIHFLVTEYVNGMDLGRYVRTHGPMSVERAIHCVLQAAMGLAYAHQKGVVHRDIKPTNLLLDPDWHVKVLDLGLARIMSDVAVPPGAVGGVPLLTQSGHILGTVDFMAPEQSESTKHADQRSDIYSLGCTLYYLLTGKVMYEGETIIERVLAHRMQPLPSLSQARPGVPEALDAVFHRMVAKKPTDRYASMPEVITALRSYELPSIGDRPVPASGSTLSAGGPDKRISWKWPALLAAIFVVLAGTAALVVLNVGRRDDVATVAATDQFQPGSTWEGDFRFDEANQGKIRVVITGRQEADFQGTYVANPGNYGWHIQGKVQGDQVRWGFAAVLEGTTPHQELVGKGQVTAKLQGDLLTGQFSDPTDQTTASLVLRLKN
jgi:hypothetical protein